MATDAVPVRDRCNGRALPAALLPHTRQRDRRRGLSELLASLSRALDRQLDISLIRGEFEEGLGRIVPVRSVHLRDSGSRWAGRTQEGGGLESIVLDVPGADPTMPAQLEATFDPGCRLGEWVHGYVDPMPGGRCELRDAPHRSFAE